MPKSVRTFSGIFLMVLVVTIGGALSIPRTMAQSSSGPAKDAVPIFEKDSNWPKPLPHDWYLGQVTGISIDANDHVWIIHRPGGERLQDSVKEAAREETESKRTDVAAPRVVEFDAQGNFMQAWGGPSDGYAWPQEEHGITVDKAGHVWISGHSDTFSPAGPDLADTHILKFTLDGKFLSMIGHPKSWGGSNDKQNLGNPTNMRLDSQANELFVSDGEANHRVIVFDANTGAYKRHWGAYGGHPDDILAEAKYDPSGPPSRQFGHRAVHCLMLGNDGLVYVCDRSNDRIQVFRKDGTFVKEAFIAKDTLGFGSVWSLAFSPDDKFLYVGDGGNHKVWILSRDQLQILGSFGEKGSPAGEADTPHSMAVDSKGNIYTAFPLHKFTFKGFAPASANP